MCKHCEQYLFLLIEKGVNVLNTPVFFICFDCRKVYQAGVGELEPINTEEEEVPVAK
jgi:hypothetical protein